MEHEVDIDWVIEQLKDRYLERLTELKTADKKEKPLLHCIVIGYESSLQLLGQKDWLQEYPFEP
ncbi:hypothetical protein [Desulfobacter curvatus]|uniref:hypothetical protein n=1 Tax=Desulfobacter curvatus TaxID=2290 RepID=UPI000374FAA3|nr:hypothetical protein [Desulfobacter curvatus]